MGIELAIGSAIAGIAGASEAQKGRERAASAAQAAQMAKQAEAQRQYDIGIGQAERATVGGLLDFDRSIAAQEKNLARQEKLISQIDPTIVEASQQALRLLRGESASSLAPLKQQRDMQRQKLVDTLRAQLGPGAETSTAGIQALTRFDQESASLYAGAQQQALQGVTQTFGQFSQSGLGYGGQMNQGIGQMAGFGQSKADLGFRQAEFGRMLGQPLLGSAGAEYTGDVMRGQAQQAAGQSLANFGGTLLGYGLQGGFKQPSAFGQMFGSNPLAVKSTQTTTQNSYGDYGNSTENLA